MSTHWPFVSVVMPIRNEARFIKRSLGAVLAQDYPRECLEILVVDGQSEDGTREIVQPMLAEHPHLRLLENPGRTAAKALNIGIRAAQGEIIVRVDGHTEIAPDYLAQCVRGLRETGADNVGGRMTAIGETPFAHTVAVATSTPFGVGGAKFHYATQEAEVDTVYLGAWRRELFERIGMFDEELARNQDDEFNYRLRKLGGHVRLRPAIRSRYYSRRGPKTLWQQYYQYGLWKVRVWQKHPAQMQPRQFVPPLFVAALLGSGLVAMLRPAGRKLFTLFVATYAGVNLAASLGAARRFGWEHLFRLPVVYLMLHLGYGLGFLHGLVQFRQRWINP